jgi:hydroxymethylglutaryl-CoA reductase (NADPH)
MDDDAPDAATLTAELADGDRRLHEFDGVDPATAAEARRAFVADETGTDLGALAGGVDPAEAETNVENMVGATSVPVGAAGPLPVDGEASAGERYLPLATTEGALVASVNRGCAALRAAGGATARVTERGMTRAPVFRTDGIDESAAVASWIEANEGRLRDAAEATTSHGELVGVEPYVVGDAVYPRFAYDTKDAMGMNMVTVATRAAAEVIADETPADLVALSGNLCSDKKPAAINAVEGRGRSVVADAELGAETVADVLGTAPEAIAAVNERKNLVGSAKAGSLGFNAHAANVVAAVFLATGQDAAQVVEGANAITTVEVRGGDDAPPSLYASVSLASLEVGTVGGGTGLPSQAAALDLLGVRGGGNPPGSNADALAETVAAGVLAGELSLLAALASRHLADAHEELGR